jgi:hypothetical protein
VGGLSEGVPLKLILGFGITARTTPEQLTLPRLLTWVALYACYFILIAAPVFNLLLISLFQVNFKKWREGFSRWVLQVLAIMGGFYLAVTRHSWRAYYNREIPSAIMGRYLIVFSAVYFVVAITALTQFNKSNFRSRWQFILTGFILPFGLVALSYLILIKGMLIPTDGNLLKSLGSVDAFFTEILGGYFFILLFFIYGLTNWLLWRGSNEKALLAMVTGLVIYYGIGVPSYTQNLLDYQTYPWLASQISRLAPLPDLKSGDAEQITVFVPAGTDSIGKAEIYNGLRTNGIDKTTIEFYSPEAVDAMETERGFIIKQLASTEDNDSGYPALAFNQEFFVIIPVTQ